jgi:hypothetical protein
MKDSINNLERWVAQATMSFILGDFGGTEARLDGRRLQGWNGVQPIATSTVKDRAPHLLILNKKKDG